MADITTTQALPSETSTRSSTIWRALRRYPVFPLAILVFFLVIPAVFAPLVAPFDPYQGSLRARLIPPFWQHPDSTARRVALLMEAVALDSTYAEPLR